MPAWTLIANPVAGGGRGRRADVVAGRLRAAGIDVDLHWTRARGDATARTAAAVAGGCPVVVVAGGDGSVAEVLPALAGRQTALGLVPLGTGNDLARALDLPTAGIGAGNAAIDGAVDDAVDALLRAQPTPFDLGRCGDRWFATVAAFGFDAEVNRSVDSGAVRWRGTAGYLWAAVRHLRTFRAPHTRLVGDFGRIDAAQFLVAVANTASYGGGLRIAPGADPTDGCFDVVLVDGALRRRRALTLMPRLFWGGHLGDAAVRVVRSRQLRIEVDGPQRCLYADGEPLTETPATLTIEAAALRVLRPPSPRRGR